MSKTSTKDANQNVASARAHLDDFEDEPLEVKYGAIKHAIDELQNAKRKLPDDY